MSRINRWNERRSATRCGGVSLVLVTLGTIGSAEGGYPIGRGSAHSNQLRQFEITDAGIVIGAPACEYEALLSGRPMQATTADAVDGAKLG
jgi:hypothetical protein